MHNHLQLIISKIEGRGLMKWFWAKKSKEIEELAEHLDTALKIRLGAISEIGGYMNPIAIRIAEPIKYIVEHKPHPKPTRVWITFRNQMGELYQGTPIALYGRTTMLYPVPLSWLTGNTYHNGIQVQMQLNLEYDER